jgi:chromosome segregation ATPase
MPEITSLLTPALILALFAWLRSDIRKLHDRLDEAVKGLNARLDATAKGLKERLDATAKGLKERLDATARGFNERLDAANRDIHERIDKRFDAVLREIAELRERMAKMEGSLEGFLAGRRDRDAA